MNTQDKYIKRITEIELKDKVSTIDTKPSFDFTIPQYGDLRATIEQNLSMLSAKKLWAKEPIIEMSNQQTEQKTFNKLWKSQNIQDKILFVMEQLFSKNWKVYVIVEADENGIPILRISESSIHTEVGNKLIDATVFTQILRGSINYVVAERFNNGSITRSIQGETTNDKGEIETTDIKVDDFNNDTGMTLKAIEEYQGAIPVILLENLNSFDGNGFKDMHNLDLTLELLQKYCNRIHWELDVNMTRIMVNQDVGSGTNGNASAAYNEVVGKGIVVETPGIMSTGTDRFNIIASNLDMEPLMKQFFKTYDFLLEQAGFKRNSDDKGSVQQNDLEIQQVRDSEITTFKLKERTRQTFLINIIKKMFEVLGQPVKNDPKVEIQYMSVKNETAIIDNMEKLLKNQLINHVDAIAKIDNISKSDATAKYNLIKKEQEVNMEKNIEAIEEEVKPEVNNETSKTD